MISLKVRGLRETIAALQKVGRGVSDLSTPMAAALGILRAYLKKYPPPPVGAHIRFVSLKQRRWFFWALRSGAITVPYRRTMTLGRSWNVTVTTSSNTIRGVLANPIGQTYGRYVQDAEKQARIHRGRWPTVQDAAVKCQKLILAVFEHYIDQLLP
jgi:hypothetical protein